MKEANMPSKPFTWILGPCSAESEEQVLQAARVVAPFLKKGYFRAGIWKPRTRPDSFEGVGERAIPWITKARDEFGMPVMAEVANASHVEKCLEAGLNALWIGARTTVNPFYVQEIAEALRGVDLPVFVKNPINPDLGLWLGAIERMEKAGVSHPGAIHRGFSQYGKSLYRNPPNWEIPIDLKRERPDIPLISDPSHIGGDKELIPIVAQKAVDLDMDGLMVEVHPDPANAKSDSDQQLDPEAFRNLIEDLEFKGTSAKDREFNDRLEDLRAKIDEIDHYIVQELASRMDIAERIGEFKKNNNVTILQLQRWEEIVNDRTHLGKALGLSDEFLSEFLKAVHKGSIKRQMTMMYGDEEEREDQASSVSDQDTSARG